VQARLAATVRLQPSVREGTAEASSGGDGWRTGGTAVRPGAHVLDHFRLDLLLGQVQREHGFLQPLQVQFGQFQKRTVRGGQLSVVSCQLQWTKNNGSSWHDDKNGISAWYPACARVGYDPKTILARPNGSHSRRDARGGDPALRRPPAPRLPDLHDREAARFHG
jgi:hypothetical protein